MPSGKTALIVALSALIFFVSLTQNSFCMDNICNRWPGGGILVLGWLELTSWEKVGPFVALAWFANPCIGVTWISSLTQARRLGIVFGTVGLLLGLGFLLGKLVVASESGFSEYISGYAAGYWLWIGSLAFALGAAISSARRDEPSEDS